RPKRAAGTLRHAEQELRGASRRTTLAAMSAAIAHEIKQPLGAIVTNANAGLRWLDRPRPDLHEVRESLKHIIGDGHRANEVIQSIRAMFAKGDHGGVPLDANELIRETIAMARGELQAGRIVVDVDLPYHLPLIPPPQDHLHHA